MEKPQHFTIVIRDNTTGEVAQYTMPNVVWDDQTWWWLAEGNFQCDCNRGMSFWRAKGATEEEVWDNSDSRFQCGDGRYTIIKAVKEDGTEIVIDGAKI